MSRFTGGPANIDDLLASTLEHYRPGLTDNWFNGHPIAKHIFGSMKGKGTETLSGGEAIVEHLDYQNNNTVGWVSSTATVPTTREEILTDARFAWAVMAGSVIFGDHELAKNSGPDQMINLMTARVNNLDNSFKEQLETALGQTSTPNANTMWSLQDVIDASNPTLGNYGDIDRGTYVWWQATEIASGSMALQGLEDMRNAYTSTDKNGTDPINALLTTPLLYRAYQSRMTANEILASKSTGDLEFDSLAFHGKPLYRSNAVSAGILLGINTKYMKLTINKNMHFRQQPFIREKGGQDKAAIVQLMCQLTCSRPASQFKLTGMTA